jgi:glycosyltransferase involved in cell wall biosynthesis
MVVEILEPTIEIADERSRDSDGRALRAGLGFGRAVNGGIRVGHGRSMPRWRRGSPSASRLAVHLHDPLSGRQPAEARLVVDLQTAQGGFFGDRGIRRYAMSFTLALLRKRAVSAVLLNPNRPNHEAIPTELRDAPEAAWNTVSTLRRLDAEGVGAYVMTSPFERTRPASSALPRYVVQSGMPIAVVLYDLIPEIIDVYPRELMAGYRARRELIKRVDLVLALSEQTRRDAIERLGIPPERMDVIGAGASDFFRPPVPSDQPALLLAERLPAVTKPFVLCVSGWSAHKNAEGLIDSWARLPRATRDAHQLVLTCRLPPQAGTAWIDRGRERGLRDGDLVVTDYVDDDVLRALYQQARLFVLPSFYEGFGLPVLEAALCGCPAVASNASAIPEVLQWSPATFSPFDLDEMASVVERGLRDEEFRLELRRVGEAAAARHTWQRVADRTISACARLDAAGTRRRVPTSRVALVGSFSPDGDRASWSARLMHVLGKAVEVDCFDASGAVDGHEVRRRHPIGVLGRTVDPWGYDAIVYLVDAATPSTVLDASRRFPGIVWFLAPLDECRDASELSSAARARLVPPDTVAPNGPAQVAPFARPTPTRTASVDDLEGAAATVLELVRVSQ